MARGKKRLSQSRRKPKSTARIDRKSWFGSMRDSVRILADIISPAKDESEWEFLRDDARPDKPSKIQSATVNNR